jgi:hypothetical protein
MSAEDRARFQVRLVRVVFRLESRRLHGRGMSDEAHEAALTDLRRRSQALLDSVRSTLDLTEGWHADVLAVVSEAEAEIRE